MPMLVQCPNPACKASCSVAESVGDRPVRCPKCLKPFLVKPTVDGQKRDTNNGPPASNADPFPVLPAEFGRYRVLKLLGRGGMGAVYLAQDSQLGRRVALKVPFFGGSESPQRAERFVREARSAAVLQHPNICTVFDAGRIDGRPFITMAYIAGTPLEQEIDPEAPMPQLRAAETARKIALALEHAHGKGIVHRDLKPANVMMAAGGEPVVMDFGLAKRVADVDPNEAKLTRLGGLLGTPSYMSPEQVKGESSAVGPATDVYALGVMLFEMLTGEAPYTGALAVVIGRILTAPVPPVQEFRPDVDPRLDAICRKAMAKKPADRFPSMAQFADALGDYLKTPSIPRSHFLSWPLSQDYNEAIQSPASSFADPDLRRGEAACNALGLPMPYSGNFADVYQVRCPDGRSWAVKCFTRRAEGLRERYQEISAHLKRAKPPFTVDFSYLEKGMRVAGKWYPVLKMQWVEGLTLNQFIGQNLEKPAMLEALLQLWARMGKYLRAAEIGHCDLQHGNVLLVPGATPNSLALKLIDYDGMWVPALAGTKSGEVGHANYQHPRRLREGTYSLEVDRFPLLLVATAMRALTADKGLWAKYDNGDNLLFKESDLAAPAQSELFQELASLPDPGLVLLAAQMRAALEGNLESAALLEDAMPDAKAAPPPVRAPKSAGAPSSTSIPRAVPVAAVVVAAAPPPAQTAFSFDDGAPGLAASASSARPRRKAAKAESGGVPRKVWIGGAAAVVLIGLLGLVVLWAGGVFKVRTADGILVVQVNEPNAEVFVDGDRMTVSWNDGGTKAEIHVKPGTRKVEVKKDGFGVDGTDLTFRDGDRVVFTARLLPEPRVAKADQPPPEKPAPPDAPPEKSPPPPDAPKPDAPPVAGATDDDKGFVPLFDGKDLTGWSVELGDAQQWTAEGDAIVGKSGDFQSRTHLLSNKQYADFTLRLVFMVDPGSNGGIDLRALLGEQMPLGNGAFIREHPLFKLSDPAKFPGEPSGTTHWVKDDKTYSKPAEDLQLPAGSWHGLQITVRGDACTGILDGKTIVDIRLDPQAGVATSPALRRAKGRIGFQAHTGTIRFRKIEIKELPPADAASTPPGTGENAAEITNSIGMHLKLIQPGKFLMGSPKDEEGRYDDEGPQHEVELTRPFYMGVYPVTRGQFAAFVKDDGYRTEAEKAGEQSTWRNPGFDQTDDDPVVEVSWNDAVRFCQWLSRKAEGKNYELPTEAEWEFACRAGTTTAFSFGDDPKDLGDYAWYSDNSALHTHPVGGKKPNSWGLYDMHGNVWQWCADGKRTYHDGYIKDPKGPEDGRRVLRGGSWYNDPRNHRSADRSGHGPGHRDDSHGFRVVLRVPASQRPLPGGDVGGAVPQPPVPAAPAAPAGDGFVPLFNGKDLTGWAGLEGFWSVKDGVISGHETKEGSKQTDLVLTAMQPADFELRFSYKFATPDGNSGVQVRSKVLDEPTYRVGGCQADFDAKGDYDGSFYDEAGDRGTMSNRGEKTVWDARNQRHNEKLPESGDELKKVIKVGDWNDCVIVAKGSHITYTINGRLTTDLIDDSPKALKEGVIALQLHAGFTMEVLFKDIKIKVLPPSQAEDQGFVPLFNGKDLTGWKTHPKQPGKWRVENGVLIGSGPATSHLYSERGDYKDFHLRVEARINDGGNSGVHFRTGFGPGFPANNPRFPLGYEAQIYNGKPGDPGQTGSLFAGAGTLVVDIRESPAPSGEWFTQEVIAEGNHIVIKVNGKTIVDYTDDKRRSTSGHITLEQHDPQTVVEFHKIEIKELK